MARRGTPVTKEKLAKIEEELRQAITKPQPVMNATIVVRVPQPVAEFLASEVERLREERPGSRSTASDVIRDILFAAMKGKKMKKYHLVDARGADHGAWPGNTKAEALVALLTKNDVGTELDGEELLYENAHEAKKWGLLETWRITEM